MWCSPRQQLVQGLASWLAGPFSRSPCLIAAVVSTGGQVQLSPSLGDSPAKKGPRRHSGVASLWGMKDGDLGSRYIGK